MNETCDFASVFAFYGHNVSSVTLGNDGLLQHLAVALGGDDLLKDLPSLIDEDGEFDLLGDTYRDYLRFKLSETFKHCPELDGVVLTLTEADYSVIHNSNPKRYPPKKVVEHLVRIFAEEHEKRGKRFILRSFGSIAKALTIAILCF